MPNSHRTLIMTIGRGNPPDGLAEPILKSIEAVDPAALVLLCTPTSETESVVPLRRIAADRLATIDVRIELLQEHARIDLESLFELAVDMLDRATTDHPDTELHVDFTGGTKPMAAAMVYAAMSRDVAIAHYAEPIIDETSRQPIGTREVRSIRLETARIDGKLLRLGDLFLRGEFVAVRLECKDLLKKKGLKPQQLHRIETLKTVAEATAKWDRFSWESASHSLASLRSSDLTHAGWDATALATNVQHLQSCHGFPSLNMNAAVDILANADRRRARKQYADAVARYYRLVEFLLQLAFLRRFDDGRLISSPENPTSNLPHDGIAAIAPVWFQDRGRLMAQHTNRFNLGLRDTATILAENADTLGTRINHELGPPDTPARLGQLLQQRNASFLAHGSTPVKGQTADRLGVLVSEITELAATTWDHDFASIRHSANLPEFPLESANRKISP